MKKTPWFSKETKPHRRGFYERDYGHSDIWPIDRWDGHTWHLVGNDGKCIDEASSCLRWRGLAKKP